MDTARTYLFHTRPRHLETLTSYSARVLSLNAELPIHQAHLVRSLSASSEAEQDWADILAQKTERNLDRLIAPTNTRLEHDGVPCPTCAARIGSRFLCTLCSRGEPVEQHSHFEGNICLRHLRWVGPGTRPSDQAPVGPEFLTAERSFRRMRRTGRLTPSFFLALQSAFNPRTPTSSDHGAGAGYPAAMRLAATITRDEFTAHFFDPTRPYSEAFALLGDAVNAAAPGMNVHSVARHLWLYFRPTFLNVRESLIEQQPLTRSLHDFPLKPSVVAGFITPAEWEPFANYLDVSGDLELTSNNHLTVLVHGEADTVTRTGSLATICPAGHRLERSRRDLRKSSADGHHNCGICQHRIVLRGFNDMATTHPELAREFNLARNAPDTASDVFAGSGRRFWWTCPEGHEYPATASNRSAAHSKCPMCQGRLVTEGVNDFGTLFPDVRKMWHSNNPQHPEDHGANSTAFVKWDCPEGHIFRNTIGKMTAGATCNHCRRIASNERTVARARPDLMPEWNYAANYPFTPENVTIGSRRMIHWTCSNGHDYEQRPERRKKNYRCPICSSRKVQAGYNDAATTHPEVCSEWHPYMNTLREPFEVFPSTNTLYWWLCKSMEKHKYQQSIPHRVISGGCPMCPPKLRVVARQDTKND